MKFAALKYLNKVKTESFLKELSFGWLYSLIEDYSIKVFKACGELHSQQVFPFLTYNFKEKELFEIDWKICQTN